MNYLFRVLWFYKVLTKIFMLDINKIRNNKDEVKKALLKRMPEVDLEGLIELDDSRKK